MVNLAFTRIKESMSIFILIETTTSQKVVSKCIEKAKECDSMCTYYRKAAGAANILVATTLLLDFQKLVLKARFKVQTSLFQHCQFLKLMSLNREFLIITNQIEPLRILPCIEAHLPSLLVFRLTRSFGKTTERQRHLMPQMSSLFEIFRNLKQLHGMYRTKAQ